MPTYPYACHNCAHQFEEIRSIKDEAHPLCPACCAQMSGDDRTFVGCKFLFTGTAVKSAEFNPGLGQIVKSDYHKSEICKQKNLVEVGNDFGSGEKHQDHFENRKKEDLEKKWESA